ncbi:MAG: helix-turn-helix domain-containing protein [Chitinophagaceae bacterium]|nr:helix-turn-helix domain-containing protein [Chitinophagaceae bacterium]
MIQVINRALDILEYLAKHKDSRASLKDISTELNLNAGTCANIIKTLTNRKYIVKDPKREYLLGPMAYNLTGNENYKKDLVDAAKPELENLTRKWNENALVAIVEGDMRTILARSNSSNSLQANTENQKKAYYSAIGRLLIAKLKEEELKKFIVKYGLPTEDEWPEIKDKENSFMLQLNKIRKQGFAVMVNAEQIVGFAVPIILNDITIAGIGMYMPTFRFKKLNQSEIINDLRATAEAIVSKL